MDRKRFECTEGDFVVESNDEGEVMRAVKMHGREKHSREMSDDEIRSQIKEV